MLHIIVYAIKDYIYFKKGIAGEIRWRKTIGSKQMYDSQLQERYI